MSLSRVSVSQDNNSLSPSETDGDVGKLSGLTKSTVQLKSLKQLERELTRNYEACYRQTWTELRNQTLDQLARLLVESRKDKTVDPEIQFWQIRDELDSIIN